MRRVCLDSSRIIKYGDTWLPLALTATQSRTQRAASPLLFTRHGTRTLVMTGIVIADRILIRAFMSLISQPDGIVASDNPAPSGIEGSRTALSPQIIGFSLIKSYFPQVPRPPANASTPGQPPLRAEPHRFLGSGDHRGPSASAPPNSRETFSFARSTVAKNKRVAASRWKLRMLLGAAQVDQACPWRIANLPGIP